MFKSQRHDKEGARSGRDPTVSGAKGVNAMSFSATVDVMN